MTIAITLHLLASVVWVGGMFFAYMALRPVAAKLLEPPLRLPLWAATFQRFFPWVWLSIALLIASGYYMVFAVFGGFARIGLHLHLMQAIGWVMIVIFIIVYFGPFRQLRANIDNKDFPAAGKNLGRIRQLIGTNLVLGLCNVVIGTVGRL